MHTLEQISKILNIVPSQLKLHYERAIIVTTNMGDSQNPDLFLGVIKHLVGIKEEKNPFIIKINDIYIKNRTKFESAGIDKVIHEALYGNLTELISRDLGNTPEKVIDGNKPKEKEDKKDKDSKKKKEETLMQELFGESKSLTEDFGYKIVDNIFYGNYESAWDALIRQESDDDVRNNFTYIARMHDLKIRDASEFGRSAGVRHDIADYLVDSLGSKENAYLDYVKAMSGDELRDAYKYIKRMYEKNSSNENIKGEFTEGSKKDEKLEVIFLDKKSKRWVINVTRTWRNSYMELSMSGSGDYSHGQNLDRVVSSNKSQKKLIDCWKKYHLKEIDDKIWKSLLVVIKEIAKEEVKRKEEDSISWSDIKDDKIIALAQHLKMDAEDAYDSISSEGNNRYTDGGQSYLVCNDDEADNEAESYLDAQIDNVGLGDLNGWGNYIKEDWFQDAMEEFNRGYVDDIQNESDRHYGNRLIAEVYEADLIEDSDFEKDEDGDFIYDEEHCKKSMDDLVDLYFDYLNESEDDPIAWFSSKFGDEELSTAVIKNNLIDKQGYIDYMIRSDGRGPTLNSYDGNEYEEKVGKKYYYIYQD